jgi:hypothetical protein
MAFKIGPYGGIGIFIYGQAGRSVPDEYLEDPGTNFANLRELTKYFPGDQMETATERPEFYFFLNHFHHRSLRKCKTSINQTIIRKE